MLEDAFWRDPGILQGSRREKLCLDDIEPAKPGGLELIKDVGDPVYYRSPLLHLCTIRLYRCCTNTCRTEPHWGRGVCLVHLALCPLFCSCRSCCNCTLRSSVAKELKFLQPASLNLSVGASAWYLLISCL